MSAEIALLGRILTLATEEQVSIEEFGRVVASSPALSAQVVRVANSALYGMEGRITRLERAILILGVRTAAATASSVLMSSKLRAVRIGPVSGDALWMHSLEIGACAELLARCLGWPHEAEAYLAGLLHDLGMQELFQEHGASYADVLTQARATDGDQLLLERALCGEDHGMRLERVARQAGFPAVLCDSFACHHDPLQAGGAAQAVASLVHASHIVVDPALAGWSDHARDAEHDAAALARLGLSSDDVADVRATLDERLKDLITAFA